LDIGADYIATGHYARVVQLENGRYTLKKSATAAKDQTYALYNLTQYQLAHTLMPVGEYTKDEIRKLAEEIDLPVANKPDSQEICFIPDNNYAAFIEENTDTVIKEGNFVNTKGEVIGKHKGIVHYTVGQRKGLNLTFGHPVFVIEIRPETNEVVIGEGDEVFSSKLYADTLNFMSIPDLDGDMEVDAKIRYSHKGAKAIIRKIGDDQLECIFEEPQRAITPGQAVVFYQGDYVVGGGTIAGREQKVIIQ
jgi:tRNA-specific 2-thiouridylase